MREQAITRLAAQTAAFSGYTEVPPAERPAWKAFFRDRLAETTSPIHLQIVWAGIKGLEDDGALAAVGAKLQQVSAQPDTFSFSSGAQRQIVCDARHLSAATRPEAWTEFQNAAEPWTSFARETRDALQDPTLCGP